jgi:hypothetical protein
MLIERIDAYWVRVPLAFVWRTSYADQSDTEYFYGNDLGTPEIVLSRARD